MHPDHEVDIILHDCFFAVGQAVGPRKEIDSEALAWWRERYRERFLYAMQSLGNSWTRDRRRVVAVGRYLGQCALRHAEDRSTIDIMCAASASADVESACQMNAEREGIITAVS